jgi:predicted nucleotidyltransferase
MLSKETILQRIVGMTEHKYPGAEVYLYGSRARGDAQKTSDWDLLVLLDKDKVSFDLETQIMDDFYELELQTGAVLSPLIYGKKEWLHKYKITPLFKAISKEGLKLQ